LIPKKQLEAFKIHCTIITKSFADDLFQHVVLIVLEKGYKETNYIPLLSRIAFNELYNKRSKFNKQHNPKEIDSYLLNIIQHQEEQDEKIELIEVAIKEEPKTKRELFQKEVWHEVQRLGSINKLAIATGILPNTLKKAAKRYESQIFNKITQ